VHLTGDEHLRVEPTFEDAWGASHDPGTENACKHVPGLGIRLEEFVDALSEVLK
jgi:hypothetical protein